MKFSGRNSPEKQSRSTKIEDTTKLKQAEDASLIDEIPFKTLIDLAPVSISISRNGIGIYANLKFLNLFGLQSLAEYIGRQTYEFFAPQRQAEMKEFISRRSVDLPVPKEYETIALRADGSQFPMQIVVDRVNLVGGPANIAFTTDISERKQAEQALHESEQRYRSIFDGVQDAVFVESLDGRILDANPYACELFGYTHEQFLTKKVADLVPSEDKIVPFNLKESSNIPLHEVETVNVRANGQEFPVELTIRLQNYNGQQVYFVVLRDISERKQAEGALRESEERFRSTFEQAAVGIAHVAADGYFLRVNQRYCDIVGYSPEEMLTMRFQDITNPDDLEMDLAYLRQMLSGQIKTYVMEKRNIRKDGSLVWVNLTVSLVRQSNGEPKYTISVVEDITARKRVEDAVKLSEARYRSLIETQSDIIARSDLAGNLTFVNDAYCRAFGQSRANLLGKSFAPSVFPEDLAISLEALEAIKTPPYRKQTETRQSTTQGIRYFSWDNSAVLDAEGNIIEFQGVGRDITERKNSEQERARQAEELSRLYRATGALLTDSSSDVLTLAQTILKTVLVELGQTNSSVFLLEKNSNKLVCLASSLPSLAPSDKIELLLDGPGLVALAARTGHSINAADVQVNSSYVSAWDMARSELTIPLKVGDQLIGAIDIQSAQPDAFSADDERLMTIFADRAALALEHARLNRETERRLQNLTALRTIDMAIASSFEIHLTLDILLDQLVKQLGVHAADILIYNPVTQTLRFSTGQGFRTQSLQHTDLRIGDGNAWQAVRQRQVVVIQDLTRNTREFSRSHQLAQEGFVTYVGVPLIAKGQIKGVLEIFQNEHLELDADQAAFLDMLGGQAAIAIDNAQLFENLQGSNAELMMAYDETIEGWSQAMDLRDKETEGHSQRVTALTVKLAASFGLTAEELL
ncbi:MAG TPA: PAS domain S-box protein, partial [Anaerolineaceae bacterium]|nr:PAS domain S-box protein [Anaerolineaceae bacterium]